MTNRTRQRWQILTDTARWTDKLVGSQEGKTMNLNVLDDPEDIDINLFKVNTKLL